MPRSEYLNFRVTETNEPQIRTICARLGIDPDGRGAYSEAINFALHLTTFQEDTMSNPILAYVESAIAESGANASVITNYGGYPTHVVAIHPRFNEGRRNKHAIDPEATKSDLVSEIREWWDKHCKLYYRG